VLAYVAFMLVAHLAMDAPLPIVPIPVVPVVMTLVIIRVGIIDVLLRDGLDGHDGRGLIMMMVVLLATPVQHSKWQKTCCDEE
jgi:hypothetical protein